MSQHQQTALTSLSKTIEELQVNPHVHEYTALVYTLDLLGRHQLGRLGVHLCVSVRYVCVWGGGGYMEQQYHVVTRIKSLHKIEIGIS